MEFASPCLVQSFAESSQEDIFSPEPTYPEPPDPPSPLPKLREAKPVASLDCPPLPPSAAGPVGRQRRCCPCAISLVLCFFVPITLLAAIYFSVTWITLNHSAVSTVEDLTLKVHHLAALHATEQVNSFLGAMYSMARLTAAPIRESVSPYKDVFLAMMKYNPQAAFLLLGKPDGSAMIVKRLADGSLALGTRDSGEANNITYRFVDTTTDQYQIRPSVESTRAYDTIHRPWYTASATSLVPTFTPPYVHATSGTVGVSISLPLLRPNGTLFAVLAVDYLLDSITTQLFHVTEVLHTSGVLLLLNTKADILVSSSPDIKFTNSDLKNLLGLPTTFVDYHARPEVTEANLNPFGNCFVLQIKFECPTASAVRVDGMDWRLFMILPRSDYFGKIDQQRNLQTGLIPGCLFSFLVVMTVISHLTIRVPLRRMRKHLFAVRSLVLAQTSLNISVSTPCFAEIAAVHEGVVAVVQAAESAAQRRFAELAAAEEMRKAHEESERIMRSKDLFFAMMSHEMRTPLTACIGMAEVLLGTELTEQQKECVDGIALGGNTMLSLVNDILDFSKIESGKLQIENAIFNVRECVEQSCQVIQLKADEKNLELIITIRSNVPTWCIGDSCRLRQVLFNLLSNAIKFTTKGFVAVTCTYVEENSQILFEVQDSGIGILPEKMASLFQPFAQADATITRRYGGTGLGLVISQRIVQMMGGDLVVTSPGEGQGCTFSFSIPFSFPSLETQTTADGRLSPHSPRNNGHPKPVAPTALPHSPSGFTLSSTGDDLIHPAEQMVALVIDKHERRRTAIMELLLALHIRPMAFASLDLIEDEVTNNSAHPTAQIAAAPLVLIHMQNCLGGSSGSVDSIHDFFSKFDAKCAKAVTTAPSRRFIFIVNMKKALGFPPDEFSMFVSKPVTMSKLSKAIHQLFPTRFEPPSSPNHESITPTSSHPMASPNGLDRGSSGEHDHGSSVMSSVVSVTPHAGSHSTRILIVDDVVPSTPPFFR